MTPEEISKSGTEQAHQMALFAQCSVMTKVYPELEWFHAIPNGGSRGSNQKDAMRVGAMLRATGVKAGVVDCLLPVKRGQWSGLYLEMKKPGKIKQVSAEQKRFMEFVESQGFATLVCDNWLDAWIAVKQYLEWK